MALIYRASGDVENVEPKNGTDFQLEELQAIVGGLIDYQMTNDGNDLIVFNDEGKLMELPYNENATKIYQERVYEGDFLVGDVLICKNSEIL